MHSKKLSFTQSTILMYAFGIVVWGRSEMNLEMRLRLSKHQHDSSDITGQININFGNGSNAHQTLHTFAGNNFYHFPGEFGYVCQTKSNFSVGICAATTSIGSWFVINWNFCLALISDSEWIWPALGGHSIGNQYSPKYIGFYCVRLRQRMHKSFSMFT